MRIQLEMRKVLTILFSTIVLLYACTDDQIDARQDIDLILDNAIKRAAPNNESSYYILPTADNLNAIPQDPKNVLTPEKVELGKFLFYETGFAMDAHKLSGMGTYSCATCHIPEAGFRPGRVQGIADGGMGFGENGEGRFMNIEYDQSELDIQSARPLSLLNVAFVSNTFWNGQFGSSEANIGTEDVWDNSEETSLNHLGFEGIETQNIEGLKVHRFLFNEALIEDHGYKALFDASFPEYNEDHRYSNFTASLAISAYLRTLLTDEAPFQKWLNGDMSAMSYKEKEGALLFFGKANCSNCHYHENLGAPEFHALGVKDMDQNPISLNRVPNDKRNLGRGGFTLQEEDMFKFKVPGIYNMSDTPFYFHGGSRTSLEGVIRYKIEAQCENDRVDQSLISSKLQAIDLSQSEIDKLVLFLEHSLRDPDLVRYKPDHIKSGFCFPNNDNISKQELNCN